MTKHYWIIGVIAAAGAIIGIDLCTIRHTPFLGLIWELRALRYGGAILCGLFLGASGSSLQGALANPLADPYILGVSSGGGFGAAIAVATLPGSCLSWGLPLFSIIGALGNMLLLFVSIRVFSARRSSTVILLGVTLNALFSAVTLCALFWAGPKMSWVMMWLMGDFSQSTGWQLGTETVVYLIGISLLIRLGFALDAMTLGDELAASFGFNPAKVRTAVILIASLFAGISVATGGIIGFVGLITPHFFRLIGIRRHAALIVASSLGASVFLLACDAMTRLPLFNSELPIGVVTACIGAPLFGLVLYNRRHDNI